jgi:hypothetical protein
MAWCRNGGIARVWLLYLVDVGILPIPLQVLWSYSETICVPVPIPKGVIRNRKGQTPRKGEVAGASAIK